MCNVQAKTPFVPLAAEKVGSRLKKLGKMYRADELLHKRMIEAYHLDCAKPILNDESFGYLEPVLAELRSVAPSFRAELASLVGGDHFFGDIEESHFGSKLWDHLYLWAAEDDTIEGFNDTACREFINVCSFLRRPVMKRFVTGPLQWADEHPGYVALYRTQAGGEIVRHAGSASRINVHMVISTPPGVQLHVGRAVHEYKAGQVLAWNDHCEHHVRHPPESQGSRIVLALKMLHPFYAKAHEERANADVHSDL